MISIVANQKGIQGSIINSLDTKEILQDLKFKVKFYFVDYTKLNRVIIASKRNYNMKNCYKQLTNKIEDEVIITDFVSLVTLPDVEFICDKLIVFDSLELTLHLNGWLNETFYKQDISSLYDINKPLDKAIFTMPKSNIEMFKKRYPDLKYVEFYKVVHVLKLNLMKLNDKKGFVVRWDISEKPQEIISKSEVPTIYFGHNDRTSFKEHDMLSYEGMIYYKRDIINKYEQFGRLIFEYLLLGKKIIWYDNPYDYNDGLKDYLEHYNLNNIEEEMLNVQKYSELIYN